MSYVQRICETAKKNYSEYLSVFNKIILRVELGQEYQMEQFHLHDIIFEA
jgi:hypothetical protein